MVQTRGRLAPIDVSLSPRTSLGDPRDGIAPMEGVVVVGRTIPHMVVGMDSDLDGRYDQYARSGRDGQFTMQVESGMGADRMDFNLVLRRPFGMRPMTIVGMPGGPEHRPFLGSPTPGNQPFERLVSPSMADPGSRTDPRQLSEIMAEDPADPAMSPSIPLGIVFLGQFVDHDVTLLDVVGQGPGEPDSPVNRRTPALDLDSVYGGGPARDPRFYSPDGLSFLLGEGGEDVLRDGRGVAVIGDERNDDNGQIARIHLAFQKFHNTLMTAHLGDADPGDLTDWQKEILFGRVRDLVIGVYQGIVSNQLAPLIVGAPLDDSGPPIANMPVEFSGAVWRLGHTLVPNQIVVDDSGTTMAPVDDRLRSTEGVPLRLLFGPDAQPAAAFDAKVSETMRTLFIPLSPTDPEAGHLIGGDSPNIGSGTVVDGVLRLDLIETNLMRGREQRLPSGEEVLALIEGRPYDPEADGDTDLFEYILHEAEPLGHLGRVGSYVVQRSLGGILAGDPYRYSSRDHYQPAEIDLFRGARMEHVLRLIGEPGF
ncbi:peroxidase family protein [Tautonia plasticadhaerens]|uniref:Peroxidase n=1 Tax=Tautonia plasticadhaerens TaxID=2527974 RepID=A0A518GXC2_9BACT|nr:peroxidase family protein [Tautonia plasticadhaerens]QDV33246.1 peroxidase [Tautonia plasticadhaerens]